MLAASVDALKGLLVEKADKVVLLGDPLHQLHHQLVVVCGNVGSGEDGRQLVLCGSHLVVLCLGQDSQLPEFFIEFLHICLDAGFDGAEVVVLQFLALGSGCSEEGPACVDQVFSFLIILFIYQEIFLLRAYRCLYGFHILISEEVHNPEGLAVDGLHAPQKRRFLVERVAAVGAEGRGDAQDTVLDEGVGCGVPGCVSSGLKGGPKSSRREGGGVRFTLHQLFAGKFHDDFSVHIRADEAVVLSAVMPVMGWNQWV